MDENALGRILYAEISRFHSARVRREQKLRATSELGANPFKEGLFDEEERIAHRMGRAVDSMLGNTLETILHALAAERHPGMCPETILGDGVRVEMIGSRPRGSRYRDRSGKPVLWSRRSRSEVRQAAMSLSHEIKESGGTARIGSARFETLLAGAREQMRQVPLEKEAWPVILDFWCDAPNVGFGEVKAGGALDNVKARIEVEEILVASLVAPELITPRIFVLYPNRGQGKTISGGLPTYFEPSHLRVAERVWEPVLPKGFSGKRFVELFRQVAEDVSRQPVAT